MTEPVEQYLRATFADDAARAPAPGDLAGAARRRAGRHQRRLGTVVAASLSVVALVTGVAVAETYQGQRSEAEAVDRALTAEQQPDVWTSCAATGGESAGGGYVTEPQAPLKRLDPGFAPVSVVICEHTSRTRADGSEVLEQVERRGSGINALLAELRRPDVPRGNGSCSLVLSRMPWFALLDATGQWVRPALPSDECGSNEQGEAVLRSIKTTTVDTKLLKVLVTAEAANSVCPQSHKDVITLMVDKGSSDLTRTGATVTDPWDGAAPLHVCVYDVPPGQTEGGEFVSAKVLSATQREIVVSELAKAQPAEGAACQGKSGRFVRVLADPDIASAYIELEGCNRVLIERNVGGRALVQASPQLLALFGAG